MLWCKRSCLVTLWSPWCPFCQLAAFGMREAQRTLARICTRAAVDCHGDLADGWTCISSAAPSYPYPVDLAGWVGVKPRSFRNACSEF